MGWLEKLLLLLLAFLLMALGGWITMQWSSMQDLDSFQTFTQLGTLVVLLATLLVLYQTLQSVPATYS
jgi:DNA-binding transcriptional regulator of glucitol operon